MNDGEKIPNLHPGEDVESRLAQYRQRIRNLKECFRVSGLINSTLDLEEVLENIMTTSREILRAEAASLMLVDEATDELVFSVAQGPVAHKLKGGMRLKKGVGIAGYVFESGQTVLIKDAYLDPRFNPDFDRKTGYKTRSILCVPLKFREKVIGVSQIINRLDGASFSEEDEETLSLLCSHAAVALENARMHAALLERRQMESDLAFARSIQLSFLPQEVPCASGYQFHAHYRAAQEVGGDFYDFIPLEDDRMGILIGDVSGKGVASALYMARLTSDFRLLAIRQRDPVKLVGQVNELLCDRSRRGMFVTLCYLVLDLRAETVEWANGGHLPPLLWNAEEKKYNMLRDGGGPPLGIVPGVAYHGGAVRLTPGDCVILATDGLIEAKGPDGDRLGWERIEESVRRGCSSVEGVFERVSGCMESFVRGCPPSDDTTIVLFGLENRS